MFRLSAGEISKLTGGAPLGEGLATGISTDSRAVKAGDLFFALKGGNFDGNSFIENAYALGAAVCVGNADFDPPSGRAYIKVSDTREALLRLAAGWRAKFRLHLLGITGSVGKTTTKEMAARVFSQKYKTHKTAGNFNNEIGLPLTLLGIGEEHGAAVVEMGMSAPGEISALTKAARPTIAVITNIGLSHIGRLGSKENILNAKLEVLEGLDPGGRIILNGDDPLLWNQRERLPFETIYFGIENKKSDILAEEISEGGFKASGTRFELFAPGRHNVLNALAAAAAGSAAGIDFKTAAAGISLFKPEGMRQGIIALESGATIINDCYNASPDSVSAALSVLKSREGGRKIAVLGDMLELGQHTKNEHYKAGRLAAEIGIDFLIAVGENSGELARGAGDGGMAPGQILAAKDNEEAARTLSGLLAAGDVCLIKGSRGVHMEEITSRLI